MLRLAQDPNTEHLGTTVWDASIVLAKYLEKVNQGARCAAAGEAAPPLRAATPTLLTAALCVGSPHRKENLADRKEKGPRFALVLPSPRCLRSTWRCRRTWRPTCARPVAYSSHTPRLRLLHPAPQNMRKGELSRSKLSGKKAIELGSGMGLGGMAFAMLGEQLQ